MERFFRANSGVEVDVDPIRFGPRRVGYRISFDPGGPPFESARQALQLQVVRSMVKAGG